MIDPALLSPERVNDPGESDKNEEVDDDGTEAKQPSEHKVSKFKVLV